MIPLCILDATVRVFVDEDNVLKAIFFQTAEMKKIFESWEWGKRGSLPLVDPI